MTAGDPSAAVPVWRFGDTWEPLERAVARGALLAIPTESSYGLGADPRNPRAVSNVYAVKAREAGKPLPVVVADVAQLARLGIDPAHPDVARVAPCWPAALTLVVPLRPGAELPAAAGAGSLAVRVPAHRGLRELLARVGPLTATSANPSGGEPVIGAAEAARLLAGHDAVVVDGGTLPGGAPSTLITLAGAEVVVLRPGRVPREDLDRCLGAAPGEDTG